MRRISSKIHINNCLRWVRTHKKYTLIFTFIASLVIIGWGLTRSSALTGSVYPDGDISRGWAATSNSSPCLTASAHYACVDETGGNSTADYINTGTSGTTGETDEFTMTSVAGVSNVVSQVSVTVYYNSVTCLGGTAGGQPNCDTVSLNINIDGSLQTSQECDSGSGSATNHSCTLDFTGSWTGDDDLQVQVIRNRKGSGSAASADDDVRVTSVNAVVTYSVNASPAAPTLNSPSNAATGISLTPIFQFRTTDADNDYLRYKIEVCSNSDCSTVLRTIDQTSSQTGWTGQDTQTSTAYVGNATITSSTMASHTYQTPALSPNTQYWWRAYAIDPGGTNTFSSTSSISSFTTNVTPAAPTLNSPSDTAMGVSLTPTFQFRTTDANNDYLRYKIEVCDTNNCSSIVRTVDQTSSQTGWTGQDTQSTTAYVGDSVISSSTMASHTYQTPTLSPNTQYWWRAYAIDPGGTNTFSGASSIFSFTTNATPVAPTLSSPADTSTGVSTLPTFQFRTTDADNDHLRYRIVICNSSNATNCAWSGSAVVQSGELTAGDQTGWSGMNQLTSTAYTGNSTISSSTMANYTAQMPDLSILTQYWWRAYAIDPNGTNTWSSASSIFSFTTQAGPPETQLRGGTIIQGGTVIGN